MQMNLIRFEFISLGVTFRSPRCYLFWFDFTFRNVCCYLTILYYYFYLFIFCFFQSYLQFFSFFSYSFLHYFTFFLFVFYVLFFRDNTRKTFDEKMQQLVGLVAQSVGLPSSANRVHKYQFTKVLLLYVFCFLLFIIYDLLACLFILYSLFLLVSFYLFICLFRLFFY